VVSPKSEREDWRRTRWVPLHPSATDGLARYAADRDACCEGRGRFFRTEREASL
jgi:hypothetical protein